VSGNLSLRMLAGLGLGAGLGLAAGAWLPAATLDALISVVTEPLGRIFLHLLFMLVIPLVLSALPLGVAGLGDLRSLGRIGLRTLAYTVAVSGIAVLIGVALVNAVEPGRAIPVEMRERLRASAPPAPVPETGSVGSALLVRLVPANVVRAMADGDLLAVMVFAVLIGVGLAAVRSGPTRRLEEALEGLYQVVMWLLALVIRAAPVGIFCLVFTLTARLGVELLVQLGTYVLLVIAALAIHQFGVYSVSVRWLGGMSPLRFFAAVRPAMLTAFSTASSNATLPTALSVAESELRLPAHVSRFVLTLGATANQNGTALFEGVTVLFLAQLYGVELDLAQQVTVVAICVLGGIGTAGVPAGSIPVVMMILGLIGVPVEGIGLILGVDRFLDMCRTAVNVTGDLAAAVVVARGESVTPPAPPP
jgi:DAACS family dicarboxylate/amino acid:cation (Na+ or H+) symporter